MLTISVAFILFKIDVMKTLALIIFLFPLLMIALIVSFMLVYRFSYMPKRNLAITELSFSKINDRARNTIIKRQREEIQDYTFRLGICTNEGLILPGVFIAWEYIKRIDFLSKEIDYRRFLSGSRPINDKSHPCQIEIYTEFIFTTKSNRERVRRITFVRSLPQNRDVRSLVDEIIAELEKYKTSSFPIVDDYVYKDY